MFYFNSSSMRELFKHVHQHMRDDAVKILSMGVNVSDKCARDVLMICRDNITSDVVLASLNCGGTSEGFAQVGIIVEEQKKQQQDEHRFQLLCAVNDYVRDGERALRAGIRCNSSDTDADVMDSLKRTYTDFNFYYKLQASSKACERTSDMYCRMLCTEVYSAYYNMHEILKKHTMMNGFSVEKVRRLCNGMIHFILLKFKARVHTTVNDYLSIFSNCIRHAQILRSATDLSVHARKHADLSIFSQSDVTDGSVICYNCTNKGVVDCRIVMTERLLMKIIAFGMNFLMSVIGKFSIMVIPQHVGSLFKEHMKSYVLHVDKACGHDITHFTRLVIEQSPMTESEKNSLMKLISDTPCI